MKLTLCKKREAIIEEERHMLVLGGPGSGKTTVALLRAQKRIQTLELGQSILFLSFSRAAIRQVILRCKELLRPTERELITVQTYHSFCLEFLRTHGRLLNGKPVRVIFPSDEKVRKASFAGDWAAECLRLSASESAYSFDLFAAGAATLLERCKCLRTLISDRYPLIVVDEFQDTNDDQWRLVCALAEQSRLFCLADPDQRIFDYQENISPRRLEMLRERFDVADYDLGEENHRSPNSEILKVADAILNNRTPLPTSRDVSMLSYWPNVFASKVHASVAWMFSKLRHRGVAEPTVAVLTRTNPFLAELSFLLSEEHTLRGQTLRPINHDILWDAELSAASAGVVASILEWEIGGGPPAVRHTLTQLANFYRLKHSLHDHQTDADRAAQFDEAVAKIQQGRASRVNAVKGIVDAYNAAAPSVGEVVADWRAALQMLQHIPALDDLYRETRLVRLFRATDALATGLHQRWLESGTYKGASETVRRILEQERLLSIERDTKGCILMTMHKSKGKEFDGVVLVERSHSAPFFDERDGGPPYERSRRLLRVGLTRARMLATIVRPANAPPLVG